MGNLLFTLFYGGAIIYASIYSYIFIKGIEKKKNTYIESENKKNINTL